MPVLLTERDPVLISIDLQRLEDLGIPAVAGHEWASTFYGPMGVMWPVIFVPEGWEEAVREHGPVEMEWDREAWKRACADDSAEISRDETPLPEGAAAVIGAILAFGIWFVADGAYCIPLLYQGSKTIAYSPFEDTALIRHLATLPPALLTGSLAGLFAPATRRALRTSRPFRFFLAVIACPQVLLGLPAYGIWNRFRSSRKG